MHVIHIFYKYDKYASRLFKINVATIAITEKKEQRGVGKGIGNNKSIDALHKL